MNAQLTPVGAHPTTGVLFVGGLLWSTPCEAADVLALVEDDDMATPSLSVIVGAIRRLVGSGVAPGPQLVLSELRRVGTLKHFATKDLHDATTSGGQAMALREYGAAVVSEASRRRIESAGAALTVAAEEASEADLVPLVNRASASCLDCLSRLARLRGEG